MPSSLRSLPSSSRQFFLRSLSLRSLGQQEHIDDTEAATNGDDLDIGRDIDVNLDHNDDDEANHHHLHHDIMNDDNSGESESNDDVHLHYMKEFLQAAKLANKPQDGKEHDDTPKSSSRSLLSALLVESPSDPASSGQVGESYRSVLSDIIVDGTADGDYFVDDELLLSYMDQVRDAAIGAIFDKLDLDEDGLLDRTDLEVMLMDAANKIKLCVDQNVIDAVIDALIEDAESDEAMESVEFSFSIGDYNASRGGSNSLSCIDAMESINKAQFSDIFKRHPDMLRVFQDQTSNAQSSQAKKRRWEGRPLSAAEMRKREVENEQIWQTHWKNWKVSLVWLVLYALANAAAFILKTTNYELHDEATAVFGQCVVAARGAAMCLNLNCALILLPMARQFMTLLRLTPARFYFPFDAILDIHKLLGTAILFWSLIHVGGHLCNYHRFAQADQGLILDLVGDKLGDDIPDSAWGRWKLLLFGTIAGVTGIIMVLFLLVGYPFIKYRRQHFNAFWTTHHLLLLMLIALCVHGTGNLLGHYQSVYWMSLPLFIYLMPRIFRESPLSKTPVLDARIKKGNALCLRLVKPAYWEPTLRPGMYAFLNVPAISVYEWHPFTLTSSPSDPFIEFHIHNSGDWTGKFHDHVKALRDPVKTLLDRNQAMKDLDDSYYLELACKIINGEDHDLDVDGDSVIAKDSTDSATQSSSIDFSESAIESAFGSTFELGSLNSQQRVTSKIPQAVKEMVVKVEGPTGAASQGFKDYPIVVLVGAGIGVTPMISVLKELLINPGMMKRLFFYWTVRDRAAFDWFSDIMNKVYTKDQSHVLQVRHFLTSVKDDDRDIGAVLLHHATRAKHRTDGFDVILGQQTHHQVEVGRPDWEDEFKGVKMEAKALGHTKCGVFLCGPERMADAIADVSRKFSRDPGFHFSFNKETF